jgi:hypothetical protein
LFGINLTGYVENSDRALHFSLALGVEMFDSQASTQVAAGRDEMQLTDVQIAYQTKFTREGVRNLSNRKPYRTKAQKIVARNMAVQCPDGAFRSSAPVSFHDPVK